MAPQKLVSSLVNNNVSDVGDRDVLVGDIVLTRYVSVCPAWIIGFMVPTKQEKVQSKLIKLCIIVSANASIDKKFRH